MIPLQNTKCVATRMLGQRAPFRDRDDESHTSLPARATRHPSPQHEHFVGGALRQGGAWPNSTRGPAAAVHCKTKRKGCQVREWRSADQNSGIRETSIAKKTFTTMENRRRFFPAASQEATTLHCNGTIHATRQNKGDRTYLVKRSKAPSFFGRTSLLRSQMAV